MSETYRIGDYEFDTYEEYLAAQEDVRKIDYITKEMDITDIDVAVRLYTLIRNKGIVFRSKIGVNFSWYLTDVMAQSAQQFLEERRKREQQAAQGKRIKMAGFACIAAALLCLGYYCATIYQEHLENLEFEQLQEMQNLTGHAIHDPFIDDRDEKDGRLSIYGQMREAELAAQEQAEAQTQPAEAVEKKDLIDPADLTVLKNYKKLYDTNKDLAGWLKIEGTDISYPVMQSDESDPFYYLDKDYKKKKDSNGSLFMDARNDFVNRDTNLIIYGHNMKSGQMFGSLKNYMKKDYWEQHQKLEFDTIYEKAQYTIVAVCLSKVNYGDDYAFRYYNFLNAGNKQDFDAYVANIQQLTVFEQNIDLSYGDELLTLSTCNSYTEDGRLFLVAKKE